MNFTKIRLKSEAHQIQIWLKENDYKINKHLLGEYQDDDVRWVEYLQERQVKLARYNEIEHTLLTTEWVDDVIPQPIEPEPEVNDAVDDMVEQVVDDILPIQEQTNYTYEEIEAAKLVETEEVVESDSTVEDTETEITE